MASPKAAEQAPVTSPIPFTQAEDKEIVYNTVSETPPPPAAQQTESAVLVQAPVDYTAHVWHDEDDGGEMGFGGGDEPSSSSTDDVATAAVSTPAASGNGLRAAPASRCAHPFSAWTVLRCCAGSA